RDAGQLLAIEAERVQGQLVEVVLGDAVARVEPGAEWLEGAAAGVLAVLAVVDEEHVGRSAAREGRAEALAVVVPPGGVLGLHRYLRVLALEGVDHRLIGGGLGGVAPEREGDGGFL